MQSQAGARKRVGGGVQIRLWRRCTAECEWIWVRRGWPRSFGCSTRAFLGSKLEGQQVRGRKGRNRQLPVQPKQVSRQPGERPQAGRVVRPDALALLNAADRVPDSSEWRRGECRPETEQAERNGRETHVFTFQTGEML